MDSSVRETNELESVVVRFAGDSGDGIQVTGEQFSHESALAGNDIATLPDFPAEIRAPAGSLAGVSGFQINFGSTEIFTPGDAPDVLVAMNPAALRANLKDLRAGGILILNEDSFTTKNLAKLNFTTNPLEDEDLRQRYRVYTVPISKLTKDALEGSGLSPREVERCKNFFTLGMMLWMFNRPHEQTLNWIRDKFAKRAELVEANTKVLNAGMTYAEATEVFESSYVVQPAKVSPGRYRTMNGTTAMTYGLLAASKKSGLPLFFGAYPITPASELLHQLSRYKHFGVKTFQAEDEIAAVCSAIGAAYSGALAITSSSGPGISLKAEAIGLACMVELPLVILNMQRGGPSTGLPTKTEQSDLLQALFGRHGESPLCVLAASSPETAFSMSYEACRIALKYMTPVILLSEGYINTRSEPWRVVDPAELQPFEFSLAEEHNNPGGQYLPYLRDEQTLARPWAVPGTPELMHRIGGIEKEDKTGNVSYNADNHHLMTQLRAGKIERIQQEIPPSQVDGPEEGELVLLGWGGTEGTLRQAARVLRAEGHAVSHLHLHYLNPLPPDLEQVLRRFRKVLVPEINMGQLRSVIRDRFLIDAKGFNLVRGQPFKVQEVADAARAMCTDQSVSVQTAMCQV